MANLRANPNKSLSGPTHAWVSICPPMDDIDLGLLMPLLHKYAGQKVNQGWWNDKLRKIYGKEKKRIRLGYSEYAPIHDKWVDLQDLIKESGLITYENIGGYNGKHWIHFPGI